jgi:branched-chain amino acid transport system substrate-binding protein
MPRIMQCTMALAFAALAVPAFAPALAQDGKVKIGFISTLSGPSASVGVDIRDGFNLAVKQLGGKLGGLTVDMQVADDQVNPEIGKQHADRMVKRDRVDFLTGTTFSNVVLAIAPVAIESQTFYLAPNAGPGPYSGAQCNPFFFVTSWPSETYSEAGAEYVNQRGLKRVIFLAPNYQGGKDAATGFKRFFKGQLVDEMFTKLGQLDYAAEIAQIRAAKPDALYVFLPGGMGINFIKQYVAAGLSKDIQLVVPSWSSDQDILRAVGDPMLGIFNVTHWRMDGDNPVNQKFVKGFEAEYKRLPTAYASQGYDTALLMDAAIRRVKGNLADKDKLRAAFRAAEFQSTRGEFRFNNNHFPIQNYYLQVVGKDADGRLVNKTMGTVMTKRGDAYAQECKMKW